MKNHIQKLEQDKYKEIEILSVKMHKIQDKIEKIEETSLKQDNAFTKELKHLKEEISKHEEKENERLPDKLNDAFDEESEFDSIITQRNNEDSKMTEKHSAGPQKQIGH